MAVSTRRLDQDMAAAANALRQRLSGELARGDCELAAARESLSAAAGRDMSGEEAADVLAQAVICAVPIVVAAPPHVAAAVAWLIGQAVPWERWALLQALHAANREGEAPAGPACRRETTAQQELRPPAHLFEPFLHEYAKDSRKRRGVFFTPQAIADYIVAEADDLLRGECGVGEGLADGRAWILDPAAGTGVFLLSVIDHVHASLTHCWRKAGQPADDVNRRWNGYVPSLLARLFGIEILPAATLLAKLNVALKLAETGYRFHQPAKINIVVGDALSPVTHFALRRPARARVPRHSGLPVVLGNPPFASLSTNSNDWIARLVRGDDEVRGYVRANGQRLNERKTWLHDDYVKFIRLAQWYVEEAGCGIVGFVTNHGYVDNATFRLMRQELLRVFPHVRIVDLHGNRKKHERSPDGSRDENVFGLDQGVAIGLFCRPTPTRSASEGPIQARRASEGSRLEYAELWGTREVKLAALQVPQRPLPSLARRVSVPEPPDWRFVSGAHVRHPEYDSAWSLAKAMPVNATAPVTARDHFVVAFNEEELRQRLADFRDLSISDDEIRRRYFTRTRSARYEPGDTRGWKLAAARRIVAADDDWQSKIVRCLYRPFDWRFVFWHPAMIDWPRNEVTRHLEGSGFRVQGSGDKSQRSEVGDQKSEVSGQASATVLGDVLSTQYVRDCSPARPEPRTPNPEPLPCPICLIARRQQLPSQPCTFFWVADCLALDGVIRSDNRGSESLFPLWLRDRGEDGPTSTRANFAPAFVEQLASRVGGRPDPEAILAYIYALFHSPAYRQRYAEALRSDFPRMLLPRSGDLFERLSGLGRRLIHCHLLQSKATDETQMGTDEERVTAEVASFRAGGYVALQKWLQPKHRSRSDPEYARVAAAIRCTLAAMRQIDAAIEQAGGLPRAFVQLPDV